MTPTLRQLEYVVAIADEGSFSAAARACGVSQPGLSAQVIRLEQALALTIFERRPRTVVPTRIGAEVIEAARSVLGARERLLDLARAYRDPLEGTIHLGVIPTIAPYLLPRVMPAVRRDFPELRLLLREEKTEVLQRLLLEGELDMALVALESDLEGLHVEPILSDAFVLAVPEGHRLASREWARAGDLAAEEVLLLDDGHCLREQTHRICQTAGACELGDFRATSLPTLMQMVSTGVGVTLLPEMAVRGDAPAPHDLVIVPFEESNLGRTIALAWRPSTPHTEAFERLTASLKAADRT